MHKNTLNARAQGVLVVLLCWILSKSLRSTLSPPLLKAKPIAIAVLFNPTPQDLNPCYAYLSSHKCTNFPDFEASIGRRCKVEQLWHEPLMGKWNWWLSLKNTPKYLVLNYTQKILNPLPPAAFAALRRSAARSCQNSLTDTTPRCRIPLGNQAICPLQPTHSDQKSLTWSDKTKK